MNPLLVAFWPECYAAALPAAVLPAAPLPPLLPTAPARDRAYLAAHADQLQADADGWSYDRPPVPNEWAEDVPAGAFVRVFLINEWTTVRVLHTSAGARLGSPTIDTWHAAA